MRSMKRKVTSSDLCKDACGAIDALGKQYLEDDEDEPDIVSVCIELRRLATYAFHDGDPKHDGEHQGASKAIAAFRAGRKIKHWLP